MVKSDFFFFFFRGVGGAFEEKNPEVPKWLMAMSLMVKCNAQQSA